MSEADKADKGDKATSEAELCKKLIRPVFPKYGPNEFCT